MEPKNRRQILGGMASLLAAPLVLGKDALFRTFRPQGAKADSPAAPPRARINPPDRSVNRRG